MFKVTPWEVEGKIDYEKLIKQFGVRKIDEKLEKKIEKIAGKNYMLERKIFFTHRDLDKIVNDYENRKEIYLYTGRGPSGGTHLGHLLPWFFTKYLQDGFKSKLLFQITDDEKFLFKENLSFEDIGKYTKENMLDIIALGFDPKKTRIIIDTKNIKELYPLAIKIAKKITFSTVKAVFGFNNETNIGRIFFTSMQAAPAFLLSEEKNKKIRCLIPCGIDQDPHFRIARDVAEKLDYPKPALVHCKFLPSLQGEGKMSASQKDNTIYTSDSPEEVKRKIMNAFTGGRATIKEQREKGGEPEKCPVFAYYYFFFEKDNKKLEAIRRECKSGKRICGECKAELIERINSFLKEHQKKREKAKDKVKEFLEQ